MIPEWAKHAIWYQVFPERFRNGCPASNPQAEDLEHAPDGWKLSSWGKDGYSRDSWEKHEHAVYARRFGGDLVGLRDRLDYLQELGVTALYLNPVFQAASLHKYDGSCFHHIDPTFGPDRAGDLAALADANETEDPASWIWTAADRFFIELVQEIHCRGMRVIIDGVFNHTGRRFFAFQDLLENGKDSRYRDWFRIRKWHLDGTFDYRGWFGHDSLPEFARSRDNLAEPVREYIHHCTRRWMDPEWGGVDGWRLDVAFCVPQGFWREWRERVKHINPDAYLTAEIMGIAKPFLQGDQFDAVMNYALLYPAMNFFSPCEKPISARMFRYRLRRIQQAYPKDIQYVLQNLWDSHDTGRVLSVLENRVSCRDWEELFQSSRLQKNPDFDTGCPGEQARQILRQMVIFQMTYVGAPMIYYGTEVGMWGANDPDNRQPMIWEDLEYDEMDRMPDRVLFEFYQQAIALRQAHPVLRIGELEWLPLSHPRVLAFRRHDGVTSIRIWINAGDEAVDVAADYDGMDLWQEGMQVLAGESVSVPPRGWRVVKDS